VALSVARARPTRGIDRLNAWLTLVLALAAVVLANRLAARHLVVRRDLSEDRLYALSDATRAILGALEDTLQVKTFFSGSIEHGEVALMKARVEAQLAELAAVAGPRMELVALDPSSSAEAAMEVRRARIFPKRIQFQQRTQTVEQEVYLGLLLRYRGREQALAWVDPWSFEVQFASAVHTLVRDRRAVVAWYGPWRAGSAGAVGYETARARIAARHELVPDERVANLRYGEPVPPEVEILFVVAPRAEHPRVAWELDRFVQRGGKLVVLVDQVQYDAFGLRASGPAGEAAPPTGLEHLLEAWGALPTPQHVWDTAWRGEHQWLRPVQDARGEPSFERVGCAHPLLVAPREEGIDRAHPVTTGTSGVTFSWCQPIAPLPAPEGVAATVLFHSSPDSFREPMHGQHLVQQDLVTAKSASLLATVGKRGGYRLALALSGRFPSPFERAPAPDDPLLSDEPPSWTDEPLAPGGAEAQVVVFGDADWLRDDPRGLGLFPFANAPGNEILLLNLLDWLTLDRELIDLRRRAPRERPLRDFEADARRALGLDVATLPTTADGFRERARSEEAARARAAAERWRRMLVPAGATLALVAGFGLVWNLRERRGGRAGA